MLLRRLGSDLAGCHIVSGFDVSAKQSFSNSLSSALLTAPTLYMGFHIFMHEHRYFAPILFFHFVIADAFLAGKTGNPHTKL
jgi:hypothetical protein